MGKMPSAISYLFHSDQEELENQVRYLVADEWNVAFFFCNFRQSLFFDCIQLFWVWLADQSPNHEAYICLV